MAEQQHEETLLNSHETVTKSLGSLPSRQAQDFMRIYGSLVTVTSNVFDMSIIFGQPITDNPDAPYVEQKASVTMSWQAAKALAHLLISTIRNYERQVGEIRLPSSQPNEPASE